METIEAKLSDERQHVADHRKYFSTDEVKADLKGKTIRGGFVTTGGQIVKQVLNIGSTAILARILTPQDYGLIAMVMVVTGFVSLFNDLGLSMATVQREEVDQEQISSLFWINVAVGIAVFLIICCLAKGVAWFYTEPRLTWVTVGLAVGFLFSGFTVQHQAILQRQMRFASLLIIDIASFLTGAGVGIVCALMGFKYWALVIMYGAIAFSRLVYTFVLCPWIPALNMGLNKVRSMLNFGLNLTGFNFVNYFARNTDNLLIGKLFGPRSLGLYSKAYGLLLLPLMQINAPISSVAIPALSRLNGSPDVYRRYYLGMLKKIALITMPGVVFMIATSDWLILLILGPQWVEASKIFAVLGIVGLVQPIANTTGWLFISQDRTKAQFRWGIIGSTISIISFVIGLKWGAFGVAASYSIVGLLVTTPVLFWFVGREGPVKTIDFYKAMAFPAAISLILFLVLMALRQFLNMNNPIYGVMLSLFSGAFVCLLMLLLVPTGRATLRDLRNILHGLYQKHTIA
jgi:PST family polysaccharide transporter